MMKKILILTATIIFLAVGITQLNRVNIPFLNNLLSYSLCEEPIRYKVDTVDPKFELPKDEFLADVNQSAQIWNNSINKNLFVYDPNGQLSVNLIYDERQSLSTQINQMEDTVNLDKQSLNPKVSEYEKLSKEFKQKVDNLNKKIEEWNNKGGAPEDEYKKIVEEQKSLQEEGNRLNAMAQSLNLSTREFNSQVGKLNQTISTFNSAIEQRPEEGIFKGGENRIEIYFYISKNELIHTSAHEFGHALGLDHSDNPKAIMYFKTNQTIIPTIDDKKALEDFCKDRSYVELIKTYLMQIADKYKIIKS